MLSKSTVIELKKLISLGLPILIAQLAQMAMGIADTAMSGRYHADDLAAVGISSSLTLPLILFISGVMIGNTAICSHFYGANQVDKIGESTRQAFWAGLPLALISMLLFFNADYILTAQDVPLHVAAISRQYLYGFALGMPAMIGCLAIRTMAESMGETRPIMIIGIISFLVNIPLNYILIYGKLGMPEMGGAGCGIASAIAMWLQLLLFWLFSRRAEFAATKIYERFSPPKWSEIKEILNIGAPIGGSMFVEVVLFAAIALILAPMGSTIVGAHQIALSITGAVFMIPLSLACAISIRIGHTLGEGKPVDARVIAATGIGFGVFLAILTASSIFITRHSLVSVYTHDTHVQAIASGLLVFAAIYQLPDAVKACANGALRAYKDTRTPLLLVIISCWLIGLPVGYILGMTDFWGAPMGARGFWVGLATGLTFGSILLGTRLNYIGKRCILQQQQNTA